MKLPSRATSGKSSDAPAGGVVTWRSPLPSGEIVKIAPLVRSGPRKRRNAIEPFLPGGVAAAGVAAMQATASAAALSLSSRDMPTKLWTGRRAEHDAGHGLGLWLATIVLRTAAWDDRPVSATVLVVDDHAEFRAAARALLEAEGFTVVGEAADGADALAANTRLRPQVVLLDIQLPDLDGFAVAERLACAEHVPVVVLISSRDARAYGARLAGARFIA